MNVENVLEVITQKKIVWSILRRKQKSNIIGKQNILQRYHIGLRIKIKTSQLTRMYKKPKNNYFYLFLSTKSLEKMHLHRVWINVFVLKR